MANKEEILEWLAQNSVAYEIMAHEPVMTIEDMERDGICRCGNVCKNLFLRDGKGKRHFLVCVGKDKTVDLKKLGEAVGARLSFASEERLEKYLNLKKGAVTPLGIFYDKDAAVEVYFDRDLVGEKRLGVHPGVNTATVFLDCADVRRLVEANGNRFTLLAL
ncbi:MAG: prolyl-tRNA synthetase associated domain-containing protein [Christensenella sp.]|nr:prolyl-tRNA synthetase associated domain-containing protein [Christensenella sp.]